MRLLPRRLADSVFDGKLLGRRLRAFLARVDTALAGSAEALPNHSIEGITVTLTLDAGLNVGFAGIGADVDRTRTFEFTPKPKPKPAPPWSQL